ncbi:MAG: sensor histidine kinase, partial [Gemmatimonadaceae bacterium]
VLALGALAPLSMTVGRIRAIATATTISLAALLVLQGYWLWRGYRDARAAFQRQVDVVLDATRERIDPGDETAEQIAALTQRRDADSDSVRALFAALRDRIDRDLTQTQLPRRYTVVLARTSEPTAHWTDPPSRDTAGVRAIQLKRICDSCDVRLGVLFDDVGPTTFLAAISGFIAVSTILVGVLGACVVLVFIGLARLRRQNEQQIEFVNNLAHEFRTPLFSISVAGKVLGHSDVVRDDEELARQVALIGRAKDRLARHAERLLDLAALQSGKTQVVHAVIDLNDLVRRAAVDLDPIRESVGARLALALTEAPVIVHGDAEHLEQAVANMLDNAFKYGGSPATVVVRTKRIAERCIIEVEDSGAGIAQQHRADIFAPFFRVTNGANRDVKGFGLGLSQVRAVVELHGGTVELRDASPNGALFVVTLPAGPMP